MVKAADSTKRRTQYCREANSSNDDEGSGERENGEYGVAPGMTENDVRMLLIVTMPPELNGGELIV